MLIALVEQELLVYEAFTFTEASVESHLNLRFKKVGFSFLCHRISVIQQEEKGSFARFL